MKLKKTELITEILYVIYVATYLITLCLYGMGDSNSRIRYYLLALFVGVGMLILAAKKGLLFFKKSVYTKEMVYIIFVGIIFLIMSIFKAKQVGLSLNSRTLVQISLFVLPSIYAYIIVNLLPMKKVINLMVATLILTICAYFLEPNHTLLAFFDLRNWSSINFSSAVSFTESSLCSSVFTHLYLFFSYFDLKFERKNLCIKICSALSLIFIILSFKRLSILMVLMMIIYKFVIVRFYKCKFEFRLPKWSYILASVLFVLMTIVYTKFMNGQIFTNVDLYKLTTGRDYIMSLWASKNFFSYGYGTSMLVIGRYLEMDLIQIYLELNAFALLIFSLCFFKLTKNNIFAMIILIYEFTNLLTASSLPSSLTWIVLIVTLLCIGANKFEELNNCKEKSNE